MSYWKTVCLACALFAATGIYSLAQTFTTLAYFTDGSTTYSSLIQGRDGNLYGTANGGTKQYGSLFKVTPTGTLTTIYTFCPQGNCTNGSLPVGALVLSVDGNFYGTTEDGGGNGVGTVFKISPSSRYKVIHSFN